MVAMVGAKWRAAWRGGVVAGLLVLIWGCSGTEILKTGSPVFQNNPELPHSTVYFMREATNMYLGPGINPVTIEINGHDVAKLAEGDYTMVRVKPGESLVVIKSLARIGSDPTPREMMGTAMFNFGAEQTNFIRLKVFNEEFRGVYYTPERIDSNRARALARKLKPVGVSPNARINAL